VIRRADYLRRSLGFVEGTGTINRARVRRRMTCSRRRLNPDFVVLKKLLVQRLVPQPALEGVGGISGRLTRLMPLGASPRAERDAELL
jgi:hypothetical protein